MSIAKYLLFLSTISLAVTSLLAGSRSSLNYFVPAETTSSSGARLTSTRYLLNGTAAGEAGTDNRPYTLAAGFYLNKPGFVGMLYEIVGLSITAPPTTGGIYLVDETATRQLVAAPVALDRSRFAPLNPSTVNWVVESGPITSISSSGLLTTDNVYSDTLARVSGSAGNLSGNLTLVIRNVGNDDYHEYASDQIDDLWQVQYFGLPPNPFAGPTADPDGDGQTNLFEFVAGLIPTDPASRFTLSIQQVDGQPAQKNLIFSPRIAGRTYTVLSKPILDSGAYTPLTNPSAPTDFDTQRTITDLSATGAAKFYRVEITKP